jgi:hypothetical protein
VALVARAMSAQVPASPLSVHDCHWKVYVGRGVSNVAVVEESA